MGPSACGGSVQQPRRWLHPLIGMERASRYKDFSIGAARLGMDPAMGAVRPRRPGFDDGLPSWPPPSRQASNRRTSLLFRPRVAQQFLRLAEERPVLFVPG